jgi:hypothetical protein
LFTFPWTSICSSFECGSFCGKSSLLETCLLAHKTTIYHIWRRSTYTFCVKGGNAISQCKERTWAWGCAFNVYLCFIPILMQVKKMYVDWLFHQICCAPTRTFLGNTSSPNHRWLVNIQMHDPILHHQQGLLYAVGVLATPSILAVGCKHSFLRRKGEWLKKHHRFHSKVHIHIPIYGLFFPDCFLNTRSTTSC